MSETTPPNKEEDRQSGEMRRQTRRSFLTGAVTAAVGFAGWSWLVSRRLDDGLPWPLRRILDWNGDLSGELAGPTHLERAGEGVRGKEPRFNGELGLESPIDPLRWRLRVIGAGGAGDGTADLALSMEELRMLPSTEESFYLRCIEGWSEKVSCEGIRFADFMDRYELGVDPETEEPLPYVGLETPDGKYYVSLDRESMIHPQTLLCFGMNGKPLSSAQGGPLRLMTPVKYGIKNLKRLGSIRFSRHRPPDYWEERGYDWYAGL